MKASYFLVWGSLGVLWQPLVLAESVGVVQSEVESSPIREQRLLPLDRDLATEWGLRQQEWARYRHLMEGPLGLYSPNLDPLTALGIEARDQDEQRRYAEMQVQAEYTRVQKLLAYQNAYDEAAKRLYPGLLPVDLIGAGSEPQASPVTASGRLSVFVTTDCKGCIERISQLQSDGQGFDLYLVGSRSNDDLIRGWASKAGIEPFKVRSREITLNHDAGRWIAVGDSGAFPAVMRQVNGQWQRQ